MLALTVALQRRGLKVVCFKCGPDYLDPTYHKRASQSTCHNLDGWIMGRDAVIQTFIRASKGFDIALVEGVMGLFDGASPKSEAGSTAEIAKWLDAPVLVTVDSSGMARTIAAIEAGLLHFDPKLKVRGLISNRVGSVRHKNLLEDALKFLPIVGGFSKQSEHRFAERHLGLETAKENNLTDVALNAWGDLAEEWFDLEKILEISAESSALETTDAQQSEKTLKYSCRIAYAYDEAFHFYYEDNLNRLRELGADLRPFSPIRDKKLPEVDGLYFGGGYPELWAKQLSENEDIKGDILAFAEQGKPIYGECGGLMFLCEDLTDMHGQSYPMLGLLPGKVRMADKLQALGYVEVEIQDKTFLGPAGTRFRGHQFRYSNIEICGDVTESYRVRKRRNQQVSEEGYRSHNVIGSYVHAHWASNPKVCENFVMACRGLQ